MALIIDVIEELKSFGCNVDVYDPWADKKEVKEEYGVDLIAQSTLQNAQCKTSLAGGYDAIVLAVSHDQFKELDINKLKNGNTVVYDIKAILDKDIVDGRL